MGDISGRAIIECIAFRHDQPESPARKREFAACRLAIPPALAQPLEGGRIRFA
jgi:hypothetical protein